MGELMMKKARVDFGDAMRRMIPVAAVFFLCMIVNLGVGPKFDDGAFMRSFAAYDYDLIDWSVYFWNNWSSRIVPSALTALLMTKAPLVFAVLNALMQAAAVWLAADLALAGRRASFSLRTVLLAAVFVVYLFWLPYEIHLESDLWRMSSSTYLWGGVCVMYCLRPFVQISEGHVPGLSVFGGTVTLLAALYAAGCEQAAPILVTFGAVVQITAMLRRQRPWAFGWLIVGITLAGFLFSLTAPGNAVRSETEILMSIGFYQGSSLIERAFFGVVTAVTLITKQLFLPMLGISVLMAAMAARRGCRWQKICAAIPCGYFVLLTLIMWYKKNLPGVSLPANIDYLLYDIIPVYPAAVSFAINQWLSTLLAIFVCTLLGAMLFFWPEERPTREYTGLLYAAAFADIIVVGFTASGRFANTRTSFIPALMLIAVLARLAVISLPLSQKHGEVSAHE